MITCRPDKVSQLSSKELRKLASEIIKPSLLVYVTHNIDNAYSDVPYLFIVNETYQHPPTRIDLDLYTTEGAVEIGRDLANQIHARFEDRTSR